MASETATLELPNMTLRRTEDGIVEGVFSKGAHVTGSDTAEHFRGFREVNGGSHARLLIDMRGIAGSTRDSRREAANPEHQEVVAKMALLVAGPVSRMIGSFFLGFNRPPYPTRVFSDADAARSWLLKDATGTLHSDG